MGAKALTSRAILGQLFLRLQQGAAGWVNLLSMMVDSDQMSETHKWLGMSPMMREWLGGRHVHGLRDNGITIANLEFEATVAVLTRELRLDKTTQIMTRINDLADRANGHGAKLLSELIEAGPSSVCYDGQYFFDTDHSEGDSGIQSNDISIDISALPTSQHGSITDPAVEEMALAILKTIQQLYGFRDDQGEPMNEGARQFVVMVPTSLWAPAVQAVTLPQLSSGQSNVLQNLPEISIGVAANPRLSWTSQFATFRADEGDGVKPFIKQEEMPLNVSAQAEGSPEEFNNKRHLYGVEWTGNFGYGFWQHACMGTLV